MMITTPREADFTTKQESNTVDTEKNYSKPSSSITSTPWTRLKDPRIVRVSRAFGGKDRHSKVCTVKGLRDRRVRLSVPTAIQLYDLQERLGLGQPSKVVDWLLNAAKNDIDELPPLQIPIENFGQNIDDQLLLNSSDKDRVMMINNVSREANYWNSDKSKEVNATDRSIPLDEKENWNRTNDEEGGEEEEEEAAAAEDVSSNKFFPRSNYHSSIPGLLNNVVPHNSNYRWDPSIFSLSHFTPQTENHLHNFNVVQLPSPVPLSLPSGSQVLVCPTGTTQPYFPSHLGTNNLVGFDPKQINHYQMLSSTSQNPSFSSSMRPFQLSMAANLLPSQSGSGSQSNNDDEFSPIS